MSESDNKKYYESFSKFIVYYFQEKEFLKKYLCCLKLFLKLRTYRKDDFFPLDSKNARILRGEEEEDYSLDFEDIKTSLILKEEKDYCSLDFEDIKTSLNGFAKILKEISKINFGNTLEQIQQLFKGMENYEKLRFEIFQEYEARKRKIIQEYEMRKRRKIIQEYEMRKMKKSEDNCSNRKINFDSLNINNDDESNKFKESQFKLIEEEKEKRIAECNEKYKNIMDKLDLIKDRDEFFEFLKNLKV